MLVKLTKDVMKPVLFTHRQNKYPCHLMFSEAFTRNSRMNELQKYSNEEKRLKIVNDEDDDDESRSQSAQ